MPWPLLHSCLEATSADYPLPLNLESWRGWRRGGPSGQVTVDQVEEKEEEEEEFIQNRTRTGRDS